MRFSLLQPLLDVPIAVIDTETTGASAQFGHKVIEVGIVRIERGRVVGEYEQLIDPGRRISAGVTALTGISQSMVEGQPRFGDQLSAMMRFLEGAAVMGHNIRFDLSFLHAEFRRAGLQMKTSLGDVPVFDTVRIARKRFGRGGNSLSVLSVRLGVDPVLSHRALADARTTGKVFEKLIEPVGGWGMCLCDAFVLQGGTMELSPKTPSESLLPLELEEALDAGRPVMMEYVDANGSRTERLVKPLHVRRSGGELLLVAHCHLRSDRRTFKLDRIVRLVRVEGGMVVPIGAVVKDCGGEAEQVPQGPPRAEFSTASEDSDGSASVQPDPHPVPLPAYRERAEARGEVRGDAGEGDDARLTTPDPSPY